MNKMKVKSLIRTFKDSQQKARQVHSVRVRLGSKLQRKINWKSSRPVLNQPSMKKMMRVVANIVEHLP